MIVAGLIVTALAAALHVYIFWMESLAWDGPQARKTFGVPDSEREATRAFAFNQGFYNLFLAIAAILGVIVTTAGAPAVGLTLALTATGSMLAAALVLLLSSPDKRRAAVSQGTLPLLAVLALVIGILV
ncbi:DUF1304 domain-containing protein [Microbacterium flavum]|uniref:DUF1304 domain-containing protein n=1 Tax=Microbacterium flavum TaxID=415216 RepID=A0ABS5XR40_9MICO|nr:DUF1304 domain-containing protein [Microbacterium flavum]MBT8796999.1 DUF1304 domain-containing protein [Microbacterium flavum]